MIIARGKSMPDSQDDKLKTTYEQLCMSYRAIDDFRAKLLGFLPLATGTGIFLLFDNPTDLPPRYLETVGAFGVFITLGLFAYELYGIKKCHSLIKAGQHLEDQMSIRGQFKERPREVIRLINEPFAAGVIYPAVLAAWTYLFLQGQPWGGQKIFRFETDQFIAFWVLAVGFICSLVYNLWLRNERNFLAELFDSQGNKLKESFFGSLKSAKNWAKDKDALFIRLTDVVEKTKTYYFKAGAQGKWTEGRIEPHQADGRPGGRLLPRLAAVIKLIRRTA
jgi:hypothetical protein